MNALYEILELPQWRCPVCRDIPEGELRSAIRENNHLEDLPKKYRGNGEPARVLGKKKGAGFVAFNEDQIAVSQTCMMALLHCRMSDPFVAPTMTEWDAWSLLHSLLQDIVYEMDVRNNRVIRLKRGLTKTGAV